ncbi:MAG: tetratricopeptide repeat protein [Propionibacteriaceae bacterium]|jgi:tetratricopeptide (TPR) repeat protein|nr:tetratricopeptide repeat protein [Propionibacteriaceae bacterium]
MARSIPEATFAVGRVRAMPIGKARAEAAAREARLIDADGPDEVKAYALESLVEALTWSGDPMKAMTPFVRLLRWWDARPEMFDLGDQNILFWEFGWILGDLARTATVPKTRVDAALDDMERRFSLASRGMERVWNNRLEWAIISGSEDVDQVFTTWLTMPIDDEDSCAACHPEHEAAYLVEKGRLNQAIAILETAAASDLSCSREPASLLALLAWCYVETGRVDDVEKILTRILVEFSQATSSSMTVPYSCLFEVYARGGLVEAALAQVASASTESGENTQYTRLEYVRHLIAGASALVAQGFGDISVELDGRSCTVSAWLGELDSEAESLSQAFDVRHGNDAQAKRLEKARAAQPTSRKLTRPSVEPNTILAEEAHKPEPKPTRLGFLKRNRKRDNRVAENQKLAESPASDAKILPVDSVIEACQKAEALVADEKWASACAAYIEASALAEKRGLIEQAGWCLAEAAQIEQTKGFRDPGKGYGRALALLVAGGATLEDVSKVLVAWAPKVTAKAYPTFMEYANRTYSSPARPASADDIEALMTRLVHPAMVGSPLLRRYILAWSEMKDAQARVMATCGTEEDAAEAIPLAQDAASRFSMLGRTSDAAHAWWLAGRLEARTDGEPDIDFRLALDAFSSIGEPGRSFVVQTKSDFAAYLVAHGRGEDATGVLAEDEE